MGKGGEEELELNEGRGECSEEKKESRGRRLFKLTSKTETQYTTFERCECYSKITS
jgi:hypothetical protein